MGMMARGSILIFVAFLPSGFPQVNDNYHYDGEQENQVFNSQEWEHPSNLQFPQSSVESNYQQFPLSQQPTYPQNQEKTTDQYYSQSDYYPGDPVFSEGSQYLQPPQKSPFSQSQTSEHQYHQPDILQQWPKIGLLGSTECIRDGFFGVKRNCKAFYRCVKNGQDKFIRYDFQCSSGTIWDELKGACNHPWAVSRSDCNNENEEESYYSLNSPNSEKIPPASQDPLQQFPHEPIKPYPLKPNNAEKGYNKPQQTYHEENVYLQQQPKPFPSSDYITNGKSHSNKCISDGFFGVKDNCKVFYRCVHNGFGGFTKYEFSCASGTVWDTVNEVCNHPWAVSREECRTNQLNPSESNKQNTHSQETPQQISSQLKPHEPQNPPYSQPSLQPQTFQYPLNSMIPQTNPSNANNLGTKEDNVTPESNVQCHSEGFQPVPGNCKLFLRCINKGDGTFTKYKFKCAETTAWDTELKICNHEYLVHRVDCGIVTTPSSLIQSDTTYTGVSTSWSNSSSISSNQNFSSSSSWTTTFTQGQTVASSGGNIQSSSSSTSQQSALASESQTNNTGMQTSSQLEGALQQQISSGQSSSINQQTTSSQQESLSNQESVSSMTGQQSILGGQQSTSSGLQSGTGNPNLSISSEQMATSGQSSTISSSGIQTIHSTTETALSGQLTTSSMQQNSTFGQQTIAGQQFTFSGQHAATGQQTTSSVSSSQPPTTTSSQQTTAGLHSISSEQHTTTWQQTTSSEQHVNSSQHLNSSSGHLSTSSELQNPFVQDTNSSTQQSSTTSQQTISSGQSSQTSVQQSTVSIQQTHPNQVSNLSSVTSQGTYLPPAKIPQEAITPGGPCKYEGFFPVKGNCYKFVRCVPNELGFTKYEFVCGPGTVWDPLNNVCNHPYVVPNCSNSWQSPQPSQISTQTPPVTIISQEISNQNQSRPQNQISPHKEKECNQKKQIICSEAGFFPYPGNCKKFYRCVDWDGNRKERFSLYTFDCGNGTIWDPKLNTCNYPESVQPPRDCSCNHTDPYSTSTPANNHFPTTQPLTEPTTPSPPENSHVASAQTGTSQSVSTQEPTQSVLMQTGSTLPGTIPDNAEPNVLQSGINQPNSTQPGTTQPPSTLPVAAQPVSTLSGTTKPGETQTGPAQPVTTHPGSTQTSQSQPGTTQPGSTQTSQSQPGTTQPGSTQTTQLQPGTTQPGSTQTTQSQPGTTQPGSTQTSQSQPGTTQPGSTQTSQSQPGTTQPGSTQTSQSQPGTTQPGLTQLGTTQVSSTELGSHMSGTTQVGPALPGITHPTTGKPGTTETDTIKPGTTQSSTTQLGTNQASTTQPVTSTQPDGVQPGTTQPGTTQLATTQPSSTQPGTTQPGSTQAQTGSTGLDVSPGAVTSSEPTQTGANQQETSPPFTTQPQPATQVSIQSTSDGPMQAGSSAQTEIQTTQTGAAMEISTASPTTRPMNSTVETQPTLPNNVQCEQLENDQYSLVCPTGFKRHPKYCNQFYQCTTSNNNANVLILSCINGTVFDEKKVQCLPPGEAEACSGKLAETRIYKRLVDGSNPPVQVRSRRSLCPAQGTFPFESDCQRFYKCTYDRRGRMQGLLYECPVNHIFWNVSRRCEKSYKIPACDVKSSRVLRVPVPIETKEIGI